MSTYELKPLPKPAIETDLLRQQAEAHGMKTQSFFDSHRERSAEWARNLINNPDDWVILDTETTGLGSHDQVVQIAVLDGHGNVLIDDQLIRPTVDINPEAQGVHGISMDMLLGAPTFSEFEPTLSSALGNKTVVIYNANFDTRILNQTMRSQYEIDYLSDVTMQIRGIVV